MNPYVLDESKIRCSYGFNLSLAHIPEQLLKLEVGGESYRQLSMLQDDSVVRYFELVKVAMANGLADAANNVNCNTEQFDRMRIQFASIESFINGLLDSIEKFKLFMKDTNQSPAEPVVWTGAFRGEYETHIE